MVLSSCLVSAAIAPAPAAARPDIINRDLPYTRIGTYDPELSALCAKKLFNQRTELSRTVYFSWDRVLLGGARGDGWNLVDPTGARRFDSDYWFRNDGFSNCEVFHSISPGRSGIAPGSATGRKRP